MRKFIHVTAVALAVAGVFTGTASAQGAQPRDGTRALLSAFDNHRIVALGNPSVGTFALDLIASPRFPDKADDIVVECGNAFYQPVLDRYIAGEDVPIADVRHVWRDTAQPYCGFSSFYETLFPLVRRINEKLPAAKKLRVLAGEPPLDWRTVTGPQDLEQDRDGHIAAVVEHEVLAKHRRALMVYGWRHLAHGQGSNAVSRIERDYPGAAYVVVYHRRFERDNDRLEARMASWPVPSLLPFQGTWLGALDASYFPDMEEVPPGQHGMPGIDAYLYVGRRDVLLADPVSRSVLDQDYLAEVDRRADLLGKPADAPTRPAAILRDARESSVLFYN
ncbi:hypothetical protein [Actinophytocola sp.]|uniref:hypothetical protein n=1 Tax=Actinophytocola sp. TaxID=1872138 RepID=UPI00389A7B2F